ncbi:hypothetical protein BD408DRAFT_426948 [Parasitella parasitica]|nr:hypothetical protein BD408DRAFT_426948 [Parasitella parasitica]
MPLASSRPLYLINKEQLICTSVFRATQATQRAFISPFLSCARETNSSLLPSREPAKMSTTITAEVLTLTSAQVATIAIGIVVCSSFLLAVYIWGSSLLQRRRDEELDNSDKRRLQ